MDFSKLRTGEIVASLGGVALFVILFLDWVGAEGTDEALSGWDYLGGDVTGFIVFLATVVGIPLITGASRGRPGLFGLPWGGVTTILGVLAFDIVVWRLFTAEGVVGIGGELEFGIFLGLVAAAAVAGGGFMTMAEGGVDPLGLGTGGTATRPATSSGSTATRSSATTKRAAAKKPAAKKRAAKRRAKPAAKKRAARRR